MRHTCFPMMPIHAIEGIDIAVSSIGSGRHLKNDGSDV